MPYDIYDDADYGTDYEYSPMDITPYNFYASFHYFIVICFAIWAYNFFSNHLNNTKDASKKSGVIAYLFSVAYMSAFTSFLAYIPLLILYKNDINFLIGFFAVMLLITIFSGKKNNKPTQL